MEPVIASRSFLSCAETTQWACWQRLIPRNRRHGGKYEHTRPSSDSRDGVPKHGYLSHAQHSVGAHAFIEQHEYLPALGNLPTCTGEFTYLHWGIYPPALGNLPPCTGEFTSRHWEIYLPALGNLPPATGEFIPAHSRITHDFRGVLPPVRGA